MFNQVPPNNQTPAAPTPDPIQNKPIEPRPIPQVNLSENFEPTVMPPVSSIPKPPISSGLNLPAANKAEDIFNETEKPSFPSSPSFDKEPKPVGPPQPLTALPDDPGNNGSSSRKYYLAGIVVLIIVLVGGGYLAYAKFFKNSNVNPPAPNSNANNNLNLPDSNQNSNLNSNENTNENANTNTNDNANINDNQNVNLNPDQNNNVNNANDNLNQATGLDSDKDGLSDEEERALGTDPALPDTDGDGLYDRDEVKVYHTKPLNPDTDGDGYIDGEEVQNGYNPNGPGKMLDLNATSTN
jgi:hypothetical protein